jgi:hypothetical protein
LLLQSKIIRKNDQFFFWKQVTKQRHHEKFQESVAIETIFTSKNLCMISLEIYVEFGSVSFVLLHVVATKDCGD